MIRLLLIVGLLATAGTQASARSIVGKWDCEARNGKSAAIRMLLDYRQNGHFYHLANVAVGDRRGRIDGSVALRGTWFRDHGNLKETLSSARVRSIAVDGQDISNTPIGRQLTSTLPRQVNQAKPSSVTKVRFISPGKIELISGRTKATCTKR